MSHESRRRAQRNADFKNRKRAEPEGVYTVPAHGWEYITVHPMADETLLLSSMGMTPAECTRVDCYWSAEGDVIFLQVATRAESRYQPGLYVRRSEESPYMVYVLAVVDGPTVARSILEAVMARLARLGVHRMKRRALTHRYCALSEPTN